MDYHIFPLISCIFSIEPLEVIFTNNPTKLMVNLSNFPTKYENSIGNT